MFLLKMNQTDWTALLPLLILIQEWRSKAFTGSTPFENIRAGVRLFIFIFPVCDRWGQFQVQIFERRCVNESQLQKWEIDFGGT